MKASSPGVLSSPPPPRELKRISPSHFVALQKCALREVWSASRVIPLLPSTPIARLGTVAHILLREAASGKFLNQGREIIQKRWQELVDGIEKDIESSWVDRGLLPLHRSARDYEVRRLRAIDRSYDVSVSSATSMHHPGEVGTGWELWIQSQNRLIGGYIDEAAKVAGDIVLRDYKTGHIWDPNNSSDERRIKEDYKNQLQLYAALYSETFAIWPTRLEIIPAIGRAVLIPFNTRDAIHLLSEAKSSFKSLNQKISICREAADYSSLASPATAECRYCVYRPACSSYRVLRSTQLNSSFHDDHWGRIQEIRILGNGTTYIEIKSEEHDLDTVRIRGITSDAIRHPALAGLKRDDHIAIFNLHRDHGMGTYKEGRYTVLYQVQ